MATTTREHRPGRLRFCNDSCLSGYQTDCRYGVMTLPRSFAEAGCCMYCGRLVPTNEQRRQPALRDLWWDGVTDGFRQLWRRHDGTWRRSDPVALIEDATITDAEARQILAELFPGTAHPDDQEADHGRV